MWGDLSERRSLFGGGVSDVLDIDYAPNPV